MTAPTKARPRETREMRLVSRLISLSDAVPDQTLTEFLARRRQPSALRSWDQISFELAEVLGEIVTDGTLRKWAAAYAIPDGGRRIRLTQKEYAAGLKTAGIALP